MNNSDSQIDENLNNSCNKSTDMESNQTSLKDSNKSGVENSLCPKIEINAFDLGGSIFNEKKEGQNSFPSNPDSNTNSQKHLTKKAILSCLNNQNTTKILQKVLMESSNETIDIIVKELRGSYRDINKDKNGNYFCSDLFKVCQQSQRITILTELTKYISEDCTDKFATHPIQTLIEFSSCEEEYRLILNSFNDLNKFFYASFDSFGAYAIQKIIEHIPEKYRLQFNLLFISFTPLLSLKQFGVCSIKKFISYTKNEDIIEKMINLIINNFVQISTNNYGNFLIQFMLKKWNKTTFGNKLKIAIRDNFKVLYENKYSCFICDLYLKFASKEEKAIIMNLLNLNFMNSINQFNNNNFNLMNNININGNFNNNFNINHQQIASNNFPNNRINQKNIIFSLHFFKQNNNNNNRKNF